MSDWWNQRNKLLSLGREVDELWMVVKCCFFISSVSVTHLFLAHSLWPHPRPGLFISWLGCCNSWSLCLWAILFLISSVCYYQIHLPKIPLWSYHSATGDPPMAPHCLPNQAPCSAPPPSPKWPFRFMWVNRIFLSRQMCFKFQQSTSDLCKMFFRLKMSASPTRIYESREANKINSI
jgi:hypothetical protein